MYRRISSLAALTAVLLSAANAHAQDPVAAAAGTITTADVLQRLGVIAHDSMRGRNTPSPGLEMTAAYIAAQFRSFGLRPGGDSTSFIQRYPYNSRSMDTSTPMIEVTSGATTPALAFARDFFVIPSAIDTVVGTPWFVGTAAPGMTLPPNLRGRIVIACAEHEWHALPAMLVSAALRSRGWHVTLLGASTPTARLNRYLQDLGQTGDLQTSMTPDIAKESFLNGESAFHLGGPWELTDVEAAGMDVSVLPVPPAGDEEARPFVGVQAFFVNANAQNPMAAQDFAANYLTRPETQSALYESTGRPPASTVAVDRMQGDPLRSAYAQIAETGLPMPAIPEMGAVWSFWGTTENAVVDGRGDPVELWDRMIDNIEGQIS